MRRSRLLYSVLSTLQCNGERFSSPRILASHLLLAFVAFFVCRYQRLTLFFIFLFLSLSIHGTLKARASPSRYRMFGFRLRSRHLVSVVIVFVLFQIFEFQQKPQGGWKIPLGWNGAQRSILRPGDYLDRTTQKASPDPAEDIIPDEDILGITHDKRYRHMLVASFEIRRLTLSLQERQFLSGGDIVIDLKNRFWTIAPITLHLRPLPRIQQPWMEEDMERRIRAMSRAPTAKLGPHSRRWYGPSL